MVPELIKQLRHHHALGDVKNAGQAQLLFLCPFEKCGLTFSLLKAAIYWLFSLLTYFDSSRAAVKG